MLLSFVIIRIIVVSTCLNALPPSILDRRHADYEMQGAGESKISAKIEESPRSAVMPIEAMNGKGFPLHFAPGPANQLPLAEGNG